MSVQFECECGYTIDAPVTYAGKRVQCPSCAAAITVPQPEEASTQSTRFSIEEFVESTRQRDHGQGIFELESDRILEINLQEMAWIKMGSMIAYRGDVRFTREGILEHGVGKFLKKTLSGEGTRLTRAEGRGQIYLADTGKKITILNLDGASLFVNGNDLLAFEQSISWDIKLMRKITGVMAGGLFNVKLKGQGIIALTTHYDPLTLHVTPERPVVTDPNATVAWSGSLSPQFKTDVSLKTFLGRGSGESIQMRFCGEGFVVVQPYEEIALQRG